MFNEFYLCSSYKSPAKFLFEIPQLRTRLTQEYETQVKSAVVVIKFSTML